MYIIKQKDKLIERYVADCEDNWANDRRKAKVWLSKSLADSYIKFKRYNKCVVEELSLEEQTRFKKYSRTKCWHCKNASLCDWAKGNPVPNWEAIPTKIKETNINGVPVLIDSYLVLNCPKFEKLENFEETKLEKYKRLAEEIGCSYKTIANRNRRLKEIKDDNKKIKETMREGGER